MLGQLFSFLIVIGIIIFIHEFGHFSMAKLFKIPVATFSLGFGPKLFGFRYGETEYKISAVPMGGYVKIHGMEDQEADTSDPNSFYNRPRYQRFLVLFMGVGFNFLLAFVLITTVLMSGREVSSSSRKEGRIGIVQKDSPAEKAGLQPGDLILSINDNPTPNWQQVVVNTLINPGQTLNVRLRRGEEVLEKQVKADTNKINGLGYIGIAPEMEVIVGAVNPDQPADRAGLKKNDLLREVNGKKIREIRDVVEAIQSGNGDPVTVVLDRKENGQTVTKTITAKPEIYQEPMSWVDKMFGRKKSAPEKRWILGFVPSEPTVTEKLSFPEAVSETFHSCIEDVRLTAFFLGKLFTGKLSLRSTSGPFDIAGMSQMARQSGWSTFLQFIGRISFQIGLINLLPIPALDGGHLFFLVVEGVIRREISVKLKERITMVGFAFLIGVMVVVLYYDIQKTEPVQRLIESFRNKG